MAKRNVKVQKLRKYRDKLLVKITNYEGLVRQMQQTFHEARKALQQEDTLRVYALCSDENHDGLKEFIDKNELAKELALAYRMLNVERKYTAEIQKAAQARDYLRVAALSADHLAESVAHDKMINEWSRDHGFKQAIRKEMEDEGII